MRRGDDEVPFGLTDEELNLRLARMFRSCADIPFMRGEKP
jgi:hypothetical protein